MNNRVICVDTRQQEGKHELKHNQLRDMGFELRRKKLDAGDYMADVPAEYQTVAIDTKKGLSEWANNMGRGHKRLQREIQRAQDAGVTLIFMIETSEIHDSEGIKQWISPVCRHCGFADKSACERVNIEPCDPLANGKCIRYGRQHPLQGRTLYKITASFSQTPGIKVVFCPPEDTAENIKLLLAQDFKLAENGEE